MTTINIEGIEFYSYHGCFKEEKIVGNKFIVDVVIQADVDIAQESDNINDTVNYQEVYNLIKVEMDQSSNLLENICHRILQSLYGTFDQIKAATVRVAKINPPLGGKIDKVCVTLSK